MMVSTSLNENVLEMLKMNASALLSKGYYVNHFSQSTSRIRFSDVLDSNFSVISELKIKSPTSKLFFDKKEAFSRIHEMAKFSDALSILTEPTYFFGSLDFLSVANNLSLPVLMKDIIISKQQIRAGVNSSAILLISKILSLTDIERFITFSHSLGLETILEVDNIQDYSQALDTETDILAINNRNLTTFEVNINRSLQIISEHSSNRPVLGFSGYSTVEQIVNAKEGGLAGVLVGSHLSQLNSPADFLQQLQTALR